MKTTVPSLVLITSLLAGCGAEKSKTPQENTPEDRQIAMTGKGRPALEFMGPYNVPATEFEGPVGPIWTEQDDLDELSQEEFFAVRTAVVQGISKHSTVYGEVDGDSEFYVYDDMYFDRTQKVEITPSTKLLKALPAVIAELQEVLKQHSLWRVMFIGEGDDDQSRQTCFVVYPDVVRIRQFSGQKTVSEAVKENAAMRLRFVEERKRHLKQRNADLQQAVVTAIDRLEQSDENVLLVAWYDTLSAVTFDWGGEGKPGSSIWLLVRSPVGDDENAVKSDFEECSYYWATRDGKIADEKPESEKSYQLLKFEDSEKKIDKLDVDVQGTKHSFARPRG